VAVADLNVVFVAPFFGANIMQCAMALARLGGVRLGVITHEPAERVPAELRTRLAGHYRVDNCLAPRQLTAATRAFQKEWGRVDRLIGYMEEMQGPLAEARAALGIRGMSPATARNFRDKNRMKEVLDAAGLPVARQVLVHGTSDALRLVAAVGYPIVLKPLAGFGAKDTMRVSSDDELMNALSVLMPSRQRPVQGEEFVRGDEYTLESISVGGRVVWQSSTYYLPGPLQVVENPWMQYCVLLPREQHPPHVAAFAPLNARALAALGMQTGLSHMEWFGRPDGSVVISEVAARPPGVNIMTMIGLAHGVDMWASWAKLMVYETFDMPARQWACGSAFFRGHGPGQTVVSVEGFAEALRELGDTVVSAQLPKVGMARSTKYEGEGWAVVRHPTTDGALAAMKHLITQTTVRYG
jgi:phosphoribosylaminoimidazole carboxylase (NCAIR synthetase)